MVTLEQIVSAWNHFFFEPIPVHSIALFRILFGCVLLYDAFFMLPNIDEYLGPKGLIRYSSYFKAARGKVLSLFFYLPPTLDSVYLVMGLHIISTTLMTVGLFTPVSTAMTFLTLRSITSRNPLICNGGENVAKIMCFCLIFTASGHAYSLDELLFYAPQMPNGEYLRQAPWALRLMQIQISIIYLYTALWKMKGATYRNGTALYYAMNNDKFKKFEFPQILLQTPWVQILTWSTLVFELALGPGLWIKEFRGWLIAIGLGFHMTIEYALSVHLFGWYMMACLLLFVDPSRIMDLL